MSAEMVAPAWMHAQISAEQYDSWSEEQCAGIEIVDGMVSTCSVRAERARAREERHRRRRSSFGPGRRTVR